MSLLLAACSGGGGGGNNGTPTAPTPVLTTLVVSISASSIAVGATATASATALDQNGAGIGVGTITWSSGSNAVATVSASGLVSGVSPGQTQIIGTAGGKQGQQLITVTPVPVASVTVAPPAATLAIGATQQLVASTLDAGGAVLAGRIVTWATSDSTIVTVSATGLATAVAAGAATITASSEGKSGTATITVQLSPVATVTVAPAAATVGVGATQQFTTTLRDAAGNVLTGRVVGWTSSDQTRATVSQSGLVAGVASGTASITATSEGKSGSVTVTVVAIPVATVTVVPATASLAVGATVTVTATALDATGNVLTGRVFAWASGNLSIVSGTSVGNVLTATGVGAGTANFTATSEGKSGVSTLTVTAAAPVITSVSPATLTPGGTVTVTGTGFAATAGSNTVRVGGVSAAIASASATQLTATVPCLVSGTVPVVVSIGGASSNSVNSTLVGTTQTLAIGQSVALLTEASVRCNELAVTGGRYLVSLFNTSTAPSSNTPVVITGSYATSGSSASVTTPSRPLTFAHAERVPASPEATFRAASARLHATMLERNREILAQGARTAGLAAAQRDARLRTSSVDRSVAPLTPGATMTVRYASGSCNSFSSITARVVSVTTHGIVLEDNASPTAGQVDADLVALGQLFETSLYPIELTFGDVNAYDVQGGLDNPARVLMLFTPLQNVPFAGGGVVLGHVIACDFFPTSLAGFAGSNQTKIFYARVPKLLTGAATTIDTRAWWNATMPATLVHEAKHLTSYAERLSRDAGSFEESWLEEATAQVAPEIYSRSVYGGTSWKGNTTYLNSIYCDARIGTAQCPNGQALMQNHFAFLEDYYKHSDSKSILSPGSVDGDIYGSAWMFVRWLVDQYGGATESTLLRSLVQEGNLTGVSNVTAKTGTTFASLLADWTMTLVADDYPGFAPPAGAKYTFPSWNTRSIWSGFNTDFGSNFPVFPLSENFVSFGSFSLSVNLPGAAAGIFELSGAQSAKQLLDLSGLSSGTTIRMSILRVQ